MDEKWFWSIVVRRNLKYVPFLGIETVQHAVQHKFHLDKIMGIASTAFVPQNNNMEAGGDVHLVSWTRIGQMVKAKKLVQKSLQNDGTASYHYPAVPENILREKGQFYFKGMGITGSSNGTTKDLKFNLLKWFCDVEIPKLEALRTRVEGRQESVQLFNIKWMVQDHIKIDN